MLKLFSVSSVSLRAKLFGRLAKGLSQKYGAALIILNLQSRDVSDKITYKPYNQGEQWLLPPSLDELVPQNHFVRIVSKTVDELEIEEVFTRNTKGGGASRYNPVMLLKVMSALKNISLTEQKLKQKLKVPQINIPSSGKKP